MGRESTAESGAATGHFDGAGCSEPFGRFRRRVSGRAIFVLPGTTRDTDHGIAQRIFHLRVEVHALVFVGETVGLQICRGSTASVLTNERFPLRAPLRSAAER